MECSHSRTEDREVGPHIGRFCLDCGRYLRNVPKPITMERAEAFVMPFGKHKGTRLVDCPPAYIEWLAENADPKTALRALAMLVAAAGRR